MAKVLRKSVFWLAVLAFVANILYVWGSSAMNNSIMGNDEYFFYRVTMNLPCYDTTVEWLREDCSPNPNTISDDAVDIYARAYTKPVWVHPIVANYIAYPIAMLFDDVANQIQLLRLVDMAFIVVTVLLFLDVIRRHTNQYVAAFSVIPMMFGRLLLANGIMFYNDLFMWFFFALTIWVITVSPYSRWVMALALVTVLCKMNAPLLLAPILLYLYYRTKSRAVVATVGVVSAIAFAGYMVFQAVAAGDALYIFRHWGTLNPTAKFNIARNVLPYIWVYTVSWGLWVSIPLLVAGLVLVAWKRIKAFYGFAAFGVVTLLFGFA